MDKLIAIFIPTYNRAPVLNDILGKVVPIVTKYEIRIYISDNASTDDTEQIILSWQEKYPFIFYHKNHENLGIDRNMLNALHYKSSKYILMLGDDDYITDLFVERLVPYLEKDYDFIVLGCDDNYQTKEYLDVNEAFLFLYDKMPYGTLIIPTNLTNLDGIEKYIGTYHAYSAIAWSTMVSKEHGKCLFYNEQQLVVLGVIEKTWKYSSLDIYWRAIPLWYSLLPIASEVKQTAYKRYKNACFSFKMFVALKLSLKHLYYSPTNYFSFFDKIKLFIVSALPYSILNSIKRAKKIFKDF